MNAWKLAAGVVLVLLVGILVGSMGTWFLLRPPHPHGPMGPKDRTMEALDRLSRDLALSPEQKGAAERILNRVSEQLHEHFAKDRPEMEKIVDEGFSDIKKILNEDQKKRFDEVRDRFRRHRGPFPPPPPPPPKDGPD